MDALDNLVNIKKLKHEAPDQAEFSGLVSAAEIKLNDAALPGLSADSQFSLTYSAAHSLGLAALRWHGYRSEHRYLVFQCLQHTVHFPKAKWRVLDKCHNCRNLAEYEGHLDINQQLLVELIAITHELLDLVNDLPVLEQ